MTDRDRLASAASLLLGERWQCPLARQLKVNPRLVRFWAAGHRPTPPWVWEVLQDALEKRLRQIEQALAAGL